MIEHMASLRPLDPKQTSKDKTWQDDFVHINLKDPESSFIKLYSGEPVDRHGKKIKRKEPDYEFLAKSAPKPVMPTSSKMKAIIDDALSSKPNKKSIHEVKSHEGEKKQCLWQAAPSLCKHPHSCQLFRLRQLLIPIASFLLITTLLTLCLR